MKSCNLCGNHIPNWAVVEGKRRNLRSRKYCFDCSPFGSGNRKKLSQNPAGQEQESRAGNGKYVRWQRKARKERKAKLVKLLGGGCKVCGYNRCHAAFDFHHRDPSTKLFSLASQGLLRKWETVKAEALKCDLLCKNHHAEQHHAEHRVG